MPEYGYVAGPPVEIGVILSLAMPEYGYVAGPPVKNGVILSLTTTEYGYVASCRNLCNLIVVHA